MADQNEIPPLADDVGLERQLKQARRMLFQQPDAASMYAKLADMSIKLAAEPAIEADLREKYEELRGWPET